MDPEEITLAPYVATCHSAGCENSELPLAIEAASVDPFVICGPCMGRITDLVPLDPNGA